MQVNMYMTSTEGNEAVLLVPIVTDPSQCHSNLYLWEHLFEVLSELTYLSRGNGTCFEARWREVRNNRIWDVCFRGAVIILVAC